MIFHLECYGPLDCVPHPWTDTSRFEILKRISAAGLAPGSRRFPGSQEPGETLQPVLNVDKGKLPENSDKRNISSRIQAVHAGKNGNEMALTGTNLEPNS